MGMIIKFLWGVLLYPDFYYYVFAGETSKLEQHTNRSTIMHPPLQNPTATPAQPPVSFLFGLDWEKAAIVVLVVAVVFLAVGMVVLWRRVAVKS